MASLFCPVCGTENPDTRQFCRKCASDLRALAPDPSAPLAAEPTPVPMRPIVMGVAVALVVVVLVVGAMVLLGGPPAASPTPSPSPEPAASATPAPTPTLAPIATVEATPTQTPTASESPGPTPKPVVDSFSGPSRASCTEMNGTDTTGYIHLEWAASNSTGVRLSIDPPAPNNAYDAGFDDYEAVGSADVPFTCDPPNSDGTGPYHLYVVTTLHDTGYFAYRFVKVYLRG